MKTTITIASAALVLFAVSGSVIAQQGATSLPPRALEHFKTADTDKDGFLSRVEAEKAMPGLAMRFDAHDKNKDGKLSPDELDGSVGGYGRHGGHHGMHGQRHAEGARMPITRTELVARHEQMLSNFDAADVNRDGTLSTDERKALHDKMRAERKPATQPAK